MSPDPAPARLRVPDLPQREIPGLRGWFLVYLLWLAALCALALYAQNQHELGVQGAQRLWLGAVYVFYLSLCCTFFPAPTAWIVMLLASEDARLTEHALTRILVVSTIGAFATAVANLNEYHIWTVLLRFRILDRIRETNFFLWARDKFFVAPFVVLVGFSFVPIPVDVVRWIAVACRYSRPRFFLAYLSGRWFRYALLTLSTVWLQLRWWHILFIQAGIVLLAGARVAAALWSRRPTVREQGNEPHA